MKWKVPAAVVLLVVGAGAVVVAVDRGPGGGSRIGPQYLTATAGDGRRRPDGRRHRDPRPGHDLRARLRGGAGRRHRRHDRRAEPAAGRGRSPRSRSPRATPSRRATCSRRRHDGPAAPAGPRTRACPPRRARDRSPRTSSTTRSGTDAVRQARIGYENASRGTDPGPGQRGRPQGPDRPGDDRRPGRRDIRSLNVTAGARRDLGDPASLAARAAPGDGGLHRERTCRRSRSASRPRVTIDAVDDDRRRHRRRDRARGRQQLRPAAS